MKNKLKIFTLILCSIILIVLTSSILIKELGLKGLKKVGTDSGWDTSYDSGSSWDSGSDWGSDSSWDGDSGSSSGSIDGSESLFIIIVFIIMVFVVVAKSEKSAFNQFKRSSSDDTIDPRKINEMYDITKMDNDLIHNVDPTLNIEQFTDLAYQKYLDVQNAWMNFDYDELRKHLTDEMYNMYVMQLEALKAKGGQNIMGGFKLLDVYINNIEISNGIEEVKVILKVKFKDYVINEKKKVIRGSKNSYVVMTYKLTFIKTVNGLPNNCPNCGAKLDNVMSNVCPYCNSTIVSGSYDWIMSKKQSINQRRG